MISLGSTGDFTSLVVTNTTTLTGAGQVMLGDNSNNRIYGASAADTLDNASTIAGAGQLGDGQLTFDNQAGGVVDATGANALVLNMGAESLINSGLLEATGSRDLVIEGSTVSRVGTILAASGSTVLLEGVTLQGGTLTTAGTGVIDVISGGGSTLNGSGAAVVNDGALNVEDSCTLSIQGSITNAGVIALDATSDFTELRVLAAGASLGGGGTVILQGSDARITGISTGAVLTNVSDTISGVGSIGLRRMTLVNGAAGVIDASSPGTLDVDTQGEVLKNAGVMEATGGGALLIVGTTVNNVGGTISAGPASLVNLEADDIQGGLVTGSGSGLVDITTANDTFDGRSTHAVGLGGVVRVLNGATLTLEGVIDNTGKLETLGGSAVSTVLIGAASVSLTGGGVIVMADTANNQIKGLSASDTLTNVGDIIEGAASIGAGAMTLVNDAVIHGDQAVALIIDTGTRTIANAGTIENSGAGGVLIKSAIANSGALEAYTHGTLTVDGAVTGSGTVRISGGTADFASSFMENVAFTATGGVLELARSQSYTGIVTGFAKTPVSSLDLLDIAFGTKTTATFSGTTTSGILTITDGTHTAHIHLTGNYLASTFTVASDNHGGTTVTDPVAGPQSLVSAIAAFAPGGGDRAHHHRVAHAAAAHPRARLRARFLWGRRSVPGRDGCALTLRMRGGQTLRRCVSNGAGRNTGVTARPKGQAMSNPIKVLHGTYSSGYTLSASYSSVEADSGASVNGAAGAAGGYAAAGAAGGVGLALPNGGVATNLGLITGGDGGHGGSGGKGFYGGKGGAGGAGGEGVSLATAGQVENSGTIHGGRGGDGGYGYDTGGAAGVGGAGVRLADGGTVTNSGLIQGGGGATSGGFYSLYREEGGGPGGAGVLLGLAGMVDNSGTIKGGAGGPSHTYPSSPNGPNGDGVDMTVGGALTNGAAGDDTALIAGNVGVDASSGATTITNFATIEGYGGASVLLNYGLDRFVAESGSSVIGVAVGGHGTLEIAGGLSTLSGFGGTATLSGAIAMSFDSFATYRIDAGASVTVTGANTLAAGDRLVDLGALDLAAGASLTLGAGSVSQIENGVANAGTLVVTGAGMVTQLTVLAGGASLTGGGVVSLAGALARLVGASASATLTNVDNLIEGSGGLGAAKLTLVNEANGVIVASGGKLIVDTLGEVLTNAGAMIGASGGQLIIASTTVMNAGGSIVAGTGGRVMLEAAKIEGGLVGSVGTGTVDVTSEGADFSAGGATVSLDGTMRLLNGATVILEGDLANTGKIETFAGANQTGLTLDAPQVTLTGSGSIILGASANNRITSLTLGTLTNAGNLIEGAGTIGGSALVLVNDATIRGDQVIALIIATGTHTVINAGTIVGSGAGGLSIQSALGNTGLLEVTKGVLSVTKAVSGAGTVKIAGGTADFGSTFVENVTFAATAGSVLELTKSHAYTGQISGFSKTGNSILDLLDIAFGAGTKAAFSGTSASGTLTVTDGTTTAHIKLVGNYTASTFTVASDGHGGTIVTDPAALTAAMAGFAAGSGSTTASGSAAQPATVLLVHG